MWSDGDGGFFGAFGAVWMDGDGGFFGAFGAVWMDGDGGFSRRFLRPVDFGMWVAW